MTVLPPGLLLMGLKRWYPGFVKVLTASATPAMRNPTVQTISLNPFMTALERWRIGVVWVSLR
jgi:hypothetical protein